MTEVNNVSGFVGCNHVALKTWPDDFASHHHKALMRELERFLADKHWLMLRVEMYSMPENVRAMMMGEKRR